MTGLVRKATLFAVCGLLAASSAMASVPSAANSSVPSCIGLVGSASGVVDVLGNFTITVRDIANLPVNNSLVVVDLSGCSTMRLCNTQPGFTVNCGTQTVRGFSNPSGVVVMKIAGHGINGPVGDLNSPPVGCAKVYADGVLIGPAVSVAAYDHDGSGVGPADLSCWLGDNFGVLHGNVPQNPTISDYDCVGGVGPADLSLWLSVNFSGSSENCPAFSIGECPLIP